MSWHALPLALGDAFQQVYDNTYNIERFFAMGIIFHQLFPCKFNHKLTLCIDMGKIMNMRRRPFHKLEV